METAFFPWKDEYNLNIEEIDRQHKKLVSLINDLYNAFFAHTEDQSLHSILNDLLEYTNYHFDSEEKYMEKINYPERESHILLHDTFKEKTIEFRHASRHGKKITSSVTNFLRSWLSDHILKVDRQYAQFKQQ